MSDQAMRLLREEADTYRRALIALNTTATMGKRKTMDCEEVARVTGEAYDKGNELHRKAKASD